MNIFCLATPSPGIEPRSPTAPGASAGLQALTVAHRSASLPLAAPAPDGAARATTASTTTAEIRGQNMQERYRRDGIAS